MFIILFVTLWIKKIFFDAQYYIIYIQDQINKLIFLLIIKSPILYTRFANIIFMLAFLYKKNCQD